MDAWQILEAQTISGDAWTRLNELSTKAAQQQVYEARLVVETVQNTIKFNPIAETLTITIE